MAKPLLPYGPRISDDEYDRRSVALHTSAARHGNDRDREVRRAELNLALDYRLGQDFPADRRRMLWEAHQRAERRRRRLVLRSIFGLMRTRSLEHAADILARDLVSAYAEVLTPAELEAFFGDTAGDDPSKSSKGPPRHL
jgi:hypothetical protein